jgi:hypothetical protein
MEDMLVRLILPLEEATVYTECDGLWYRLGERLPRFDVPEGDGSDWPPIDRVIFPEPVKAVLSREGLKTPLSIRLVRDATPALRPASALRCSPVSLAAWAERATSAALAALKGAWLGPGSGNGSEAVVVVTGAPEVLPLLAEGLRFWGTELFVPLGFRTEPDLPASAIREAAGAKPDELAVMDQDGIELIPRNIFKPLSRAAVRMIQEGSTSTGKGST